MIFSVLNFEKRLTADALQKKIEILARLGRKGAGRLKSFENVLDITSKAYLSIDRRAAEGTRAVGGALWLYENYPLFEETLLSVRQSTKSKNSFPLVRRGEYAGIPRGVALALLMLRHSDCEITEEKLIDALETFMQISPLWQNELWHIPAFFHYALTCLCAGIARDIDDFEAARDAAKPWHEQLLAGESALNSSKLKSLLKKPAFSERLIALSRDDGDALTPKIEAAAANAGVVIGEMVEKAHKIQSLLQIRIANCAASIRAISAMDWISVFESVNPVGKLLEKERVGVFLRSDFDSRQALFAEVSKLAKRARKEEVEIARLALDIADENSVDLSEALLGGFRKQLKNAAGIKRIEIRGKKWLFMLLTSLLSIISAIAVGKMVSVFAALLLMIPCASVSVWLMTAIFTRVIKPRRLLRYDFHGKLPDEARTAVIISALITGSDTLFEQAERMERLYIANNDENLLIILAADFPDAPAEYVAGDDELLHLEQSLINSLNGRYETDCFCCFHRKREVAPEGRYMAKERKRGAISAVNRHMLFGEGSFSLKIFPQEKVGKIKYALALDADTRILPGAIRELAGIIAHPANRKYAIISPRVATPLDSIKTRLQSIAGGNAGLSAYSGICSELYQDMAGEGIYCGKGLYDISRFENALGGKIPDNTLLSHDLLEGLFAKCAFAADIVFFDGGPSHIAGHYKRQHRWTRGDFQLLPWLLTKRGKGLTSLDRWKILDNLRRWLLPAFTLAGLLYLCSTGHFAFAYAVLLAYLLTAPWEKFHIAAALLPKDAWTSAHAAAVTLWRITVSKRGLLQWTTAAQAEKNSSSDIWQLTACFVSAVALLAACAIPPSQSSLWFAAPVAALWIITGFSSRAFGKPAEKHSSLSEDERATLIRIARKTYSWFEQFLGERNNFLPPDNVQILPYRGAAERTSPTNIGYAMCAHAAAYDLGFIDAAMLCDRLAKTMSTIERMEKWHGHLYNWYDTKSLLPLYPKYVSSVDSGNLTACAMLCAKTLRDAARTTFDTQKIKDGCLALIALDGLDSAENEALKAAVSKSENAAMLNAAIGLVSAMRRPGAKALTLRDLRFSETAPADAMEALAQKMDDFVSDMRLEKLYDKKKKLFYIGYDAQNSAFSRSRYDLLASESRLTSIVAIGKGDVPFEHYAALGRPMTALKAGNALLSWSGTMFEYLMPRLFIKEDLRSIAGASCVTAVKSQAKNSGGTIWGESESGYYAFDLDLQYQYKAFGEESLSLKGMPDREHVVAPYAALLALSVDAKEVMPNINAMIAEGLEGEYGMFEAIDFSKSENGDIVRSYMAHHQGMGLMAIEQALAGSCQRRFTDIPEIGAYELLTGETMPLYVKKRVRVTAKKQMDEQRHQSLGRKSCAEGLDMHMLSGAGTTVFTYNGGNHILCGNALLTRMRSGSPYNGIHVFIKSKNTLFSPTLEGDAAFAEDSTVYSASKGDISAAVSISVSPENGAVVIKTDVRNLGAMWQEVEVGCYFEPSLQLPGADAAHPAFSDLFIDVSECEEGLLIRRRDRDGEGDVYAFFSSTGGKCGGFATSREDFIGRNNNLFTARGHSLPATGKSGSQITPCAYVRRIIKVKPDLQEEVCFAAGRSDSGAQSLLHLRDFSDSSAVRRAISMAGMKAQVLGEYLNITSKKLTAWERLAAVAHQPFKSSREAITPTAFPARDTIWRCGISGDLPIITAFISDVPQLELVRELIEAKEYFGIKGFKADLVFVNSYGSDYLRPVGAGIDQLIRGSVFHDKIGRPASVHIIDGSLLSEQDKQNLRIYSSAVLTGGAGSLSAQVDALAAPKSREAFAEFSKPDAGFHELRMKAPVYAIKSGMGGFLDDGSYAMLLKKGETTPMPYSNIMANENFGALITESGGGYTWAKNSREFKLTPWRNDPITDMPSENIYIRDEESGSVTSLFGCLEKGERFIKHGQGYTVFATMWQGIQLNLTVFADSKKSAKCYLIEAKNMCGRHRALSLTAYASWVLGANKRETAHLIHTMFSGQSLYAQNANHPCEYAYLSAPMGKILGYTCDESEFIGENSGGIPCGLKRRALSCSQSGDPCAAITVAMPLDNSAQGRLHFLLGYTTDISKNNDEVIEYLPEKALGAVKRLWQKRLAAVKIETPDKQLNMLVNNWLPYQSWTSRILGRTGLYQAGGAFGFRDQLQDVTCLLPYDSTLAKNHIILSCRHQFTDGDVQHWWHPPRSGVRTRITDDMLFLPWAVCEYVKATGDVDILNEQTPYLEAVSIPGGKHDLYFEPSETALTESVYQHCKRAIERASAFGAHGLAMMGGGDWNDAMNLVGIGGRGESVWLSWFLIYVLENFADMSEKIGQPCAGYHDRAQKLRSAVELHGWDGKWYRRAYFDDGTPIGASGNVECEIDLIAQSWAAFAGRNDARIDMALGSAYDLLFDKENGIVKLLAPPFERNNPRPGYIQGYTPGVRENGGQYTHGAAWFLLALCKTGQAEKALEILHALLPASHNDSAEKMLIYKAEPYVVAADVYSGEFTGRGGWTWYTGAAGWLLKAVLEGMLGITVESGEVKIAPPDIVWNHFNVTILQKKYSCTKQEGGWLIDTDN